MDKITTGNDLLIEALESKKRETLHHIEVLENHINHLKEEGAKKKFRLANLFKSLFQGSKR